MIWLFQKGVTPQLSVDPLPLLAARPLSDCDSESSYFTRAYYVQFSSYLSPTPAVFHTPSFASHAHHVTEVQSAC